MAFLNIDTVTKKTKTGYQIRLATQAEAKQTSDSQNWRIPKADRPKKVIGCDNCVIYPPNYQDNTVMIQGDKIQAKFDFKTGMGRLYVKGMGSYTGDYTGMGYSLYNIAYDFNQCPEVIQAVLNQLPSKGTLQDTNTGVSVQY